MSEEELNPWIGRLVRFAFGAAFGILAGLYWGEGSWPAALATALVCGLLAAWLKDEFWESLGSWWG